MQDDLGLQLLVEEMLLEILERVLESQCLTRILYSKWCAVQDVLGGESGMGDS